MTDFFKNQTKVEETSLNFTIDYLAVEMDQSPQTPMPERHPKKLPSYANNIIDVPEREDYFLYDCTTDLLDETILPGAVAEFGSGVRCDILFKIVDLDQVEIHAGKIYIEDACVANATLRIYKDEELGQEPYRIVIKVFMEVIYVKLKFFSSSKDKFEKTIYAKYQIKNIEPRTLELLEESSSGDHLYTIDLGLVLNYWTSVFKVPLIRYLNDVGYYSQPFHFSTEAFRFFVNSLIDEFAIDFYDSYSILNYEPNLTYEGLLDIVLLEILENDYLES
mmetsp:Transcript_18931/g.18076  ORF Transcript_18931/g.18076 Transcript_18931/m.18076 type:complete len:277 (+) Transcript_18931:487-1317(+)